MKQVMISELKAHLSEALRAVKAGETYVVGGFAPAVGRHAPGVAHRASGGAVARNYIVPSESRRVSRIIVFVVPSLSRRAMFL